MLILNCRSLWRCPTWKYTTRKSEICSIPRGECSAVTEWNVWKAFSWFIYCNHHDVIIIIFSPLPPIPPPHPSEKHHLKVREHLVLGPYVENLSKLAVRSFCVRVCPTGCVLWGVVYGVYSMGCVLWGVFYGVYSMGCVL